MGRAVDGAGDEGRHLALVSFGATSSFVKIGSSSE
jgi:hypothetical protein